MSTVEYSHSELRGLFVVPGAALFVFSCLSFVDSSLNLFVVVVLFCFFVFVLFCSVFFFACLFSRAFLSKKLKCMSSDICPFKFHIRSNVGIMAGNRDTVNQSES